VAIARAKGTLGAAAEMARFGVRAAIIATGLQIASGFWLLFAVPRDVLIAFMREGAATMIPLTVGIVAGVALLIFLVLIRDPIAEKRFVRRAVELTAVAVLFMVITRHQLRALTLAPARADEAVQAAPQWGIIAAFAVTFLAAAGLTVYSLVRAVKDRAGDGEEAA
jgi:hypothetical protein